MFSLLVVSRLGCAEEPTIQTRLGVRAEARVVEGRYNSLWLFGDMDAKELKATTAGLKFVMKLGDSWESREIMRLRKQTADMMKVIIDQDKKIIRVLQQKDKKIKSILDQK
jgi:hypothetical protein